jgi:hypothetical protein
MPRQRRNDLNPPLYVCVLHGHHSTTSASFKRLKVRFVPYIPGTNGFVQDSTKNSSRRSSETVARTLLRKTH